MSNFLMTFLKSCVLTGITLGATKATGTPYAAVVTPVAAIALKYITDYWKVK